MVSTSRSFLYSKQSLCLLSALTTENDRFDMLCQWPRTTESLAPKFELHLY